MREVGVMRRELLPALNQQRRDPRRIVGIDRPWESNKPAQIPRSVYRFNAYGFTSDSYDRGCPSGEGCGVLTGHYATHAGVDLFGVNKLYSPLSFFCCTKPLSFVYNTRWLSGGDGGRPSCYLRLSLLCTFNNGVQHIKLVLRDGTSAILVRVVSAGEYRNGYVLLYTSIHQLLPKGVRRWRSAAGRFTRAAQQVGLLRAVVTKRLSLFGSSLAST